MLTRLLALCLLCLTAGTAQAALQIQITGGINEGRKIIVLPFEQPAGVRVDIAAVVNADLMRSGKFSPLAAARIPPAAFHGTRLNLEALASTQAEAVVVGRVYQDAAGYQVEHQLIALQGAARGQILEHRRGPSTLADMRQAAHRVSDRVYEKLTGQPGAFRTRIAYIVYKAGDNFPYQLMTADYDGFNEVPVLKSTEPVMTPSWSRQGDRLVYVSFERRRPAIFIHNIYTRQRVMLASYPGLNSSPAWSPDGTKIAMTLSKDGNPEIYYYDLTRKRLQRVTHTAAIDTEPSWSEDSQSLYFTSERGGKAQIYRYTLATGQTERVTFQGTMNLSSRPVPGTDYIIVITQHNGFRVARVDSDGSLYMLTTSSLDESPSVAPNGSMIIYCTVYQGRKGLALVSADGRFKANLPSTSGEVSAPAWGPLQPLP